MTVFVIIETYFNGYGDSTRVRQQAYFCKDKAEGVCRDLNAGVGCSGSTFEVEDIEVG